MSPSATLSLDAACRRSWPAVIVGAGPAGATAARELARRGADVLLIDRAVFPRWKICGACVNGWALRTLSAIGLGGLPERLNAVPLSQVVLACAGAEATVRLGGWVAVSRQSFDAALIEEAIRAGAHFLDDTRASHLTATADRISVRLTRGDRHAFVAARVVLAADGLGGSLVSGLAGFRRSVEPGSWVGAGSILMDRSDAYGPQTIHLVCESGGYVGLVRLEDGRLNVGAAFEPTFLRRSGGPGLATVRVLGAAGKMIPAGMLKSAWRGTPALTRRTVPAAADRVFVLGDAAGYVEPFTGEGMAWALASAAAVAPLAAAAAQRWRPSLASRWDRARRDLLQRHTLLCRLTARALHSPALVRMLVEVLRRAPALAGPFVRQLSAGAVPAQGASP